MIARAVVLLVRWWSFTVWDVYQWEDSGRACNYRSDNNGVLHIVVNFLVIEGWCLGSDVRLRAISVDTTTRERRCHLTRLYLLIKSNFRIDISVRIIRCKFLVPWLCKGKCGICSGIYYFGWSIAVLFSSSWPCIYLVAAVCQWQMWIFARYPKALRSLDGNENLWSTRLLRNDPQLLSHFNPQRVCARITDVRKASWKNPWVYCNRL